MWIGIGNTIPMISNLPGQSTPGPTPPAGNFIELEPNLFLIALESGLNDLIELEKITTNSNIIILSDEVYEHLIYDNQDHH